VSGKSDAGSAPVSKTRDSSSRKEGIAARPLHQRLGIALAEGLLTELRSNEVEAVASVERREPERGHGQPVAGAHVLDGPRRHDQQDGEAIQALRQIGQGLARRRIHPVDILEGEHHDALVGKAPQQVEDQPEGPLAAHVRRQGQTRRVLGSLRAHEILPEGAIDGVRRQGRSETVRHGVTERPAKLTHDRERRVPRPRVAMQDEAVQVVLLYRFQEFQEQARLADSRLAGQDDGMPATAPDTVEAIAKKGQFRPPTDEVGKARSLAQDRSKRCGGQTIKG